MSIELVAALVGVWVFGSVPLGMLVGRWLGAQSLALEEHERLQLQHQPILISVSQPTNRRAA